MAETKRLLKAARKCIDDKNYKESLSLCREVLRKDRKNYFGLVFIGKSLQVSKLAVSAFKTAISINPRNPLAWKGLANIYEQKEDLEAKFKLLTIYNHLLHMKIGTCKAVDIIIKVSQLGILLKTQKSINIILRCLDMKPGLEVFNTAVNELPKLLLSNIKHEGKNILKAINHITYKIWKQPNQLLCVMVTQSVLINNIKIDALVETILTSCVEAHILFRLWICKYICGQFVKNEHFSGIDIEKYKNKLTSGFEMNKYSILLTSMISYSKGLYYQAYLQFVPNPFSRKTKYIEGIYIIKCNIKLGRWMIVERITTEFAIGNEDAGYLIELKKYKLLALAQQKKWQQASIVGKSIPVESLDVDEQATLAMCFIENEEKDNAEDLLENLRQTEYYLQLKALSWLVQKEYRKVIALLRDSEPNLVNFITIAKAYWELKEFQYCHKYLIKAIGLDSKNAEVNLYLGMWHHYYKDEYDIARRFYESAYEINSSDNAIVKNLSDIYLKLNMKSNHLILLQTHSIFSPDQKWVHFRLGQLHMANKDWANACNAFIRHLRYYNNDAIAFICLAEANYARHSFIIAIENYKQAMTLDLNQKIFCLTRIGYIYNSIDDHTAALRTFKKVFEMDPNYILAFKGAANALMNSAEVVAEIGHYDIARDGLQVAVNYMIRGLGMAKIFTIFWRLLGKALMMLLDLPEGYKFVEVNFVNNDELLDLGILYMESTITKLAEYCFWRAYCDPPPYLRKTRGRDLSMEIIMEEQSVNPNGLAFRPLPNRLSYTQWVYEFLNYRSLYANF